jgi:choline/glycine/proline betaine transport protein
MLEALAQKLGLRANPVVFFSAAAFIVVFVVFAAAFTETASRSFEVIQTFITTRFGWLYIVAVATFLGFCAWLCMSRFGAVRLGPDNARPKYSYLTWFAMLFSAGMGIGLVFYSVAEPIMHFANPPHGEGHTVEAAKVSMNATFYHWGLHAWGVYCLMGVSLAYFAYRWELPLRVRSVFYPLLGRRIDGPIGDAIDLLAVLGTMFGVATSLGLGAMQVNQGLDKLFGFEVSTSNQLVLIAAITVLATTSVVSGVDKGIRRLSEANLIMASLLLGFVFFVGPTLFLLGSFVEGIGYYLQHLVGTMFWSDAFRGDDASGEASWQQGWTLFYWGWWIAWAPFVGTFIARISYGRTIREFVLGVLFVPTTITFFWLAVFGNSAIGIELHGDGGLAEVVEENLPIAIFALLEEFPWVAFTSLLTTIVIVVFFVTSSDSASLVMDILTSGTQHSPTRQRVFWATSEGAVAAVLLVVGGAEGLAALQTASIAMGLPFCVVLIFICYSLYRGLSEEPVMPGMLTSEERHER